MLSLMPDKWNEWIYDSNHPRYNSDEAKYLRERRQAALNSCPKWMIEAARNNDLNKLSVYPERLK